MSDAPEAPIEQLPPAMPPDVMEGMRRGDAAARALNGNAVVTRRNPDTNAWWVVVETNEGGPAWCVVSYTLAHDDTPQNQWWHTSRFAAEQAVERMAQGLPPEVPGLPDQPLPEPVTGTALEALKETLRRGVDAAAEQTRLRYITPGTGQAMVYLAKEEEARAVLALQGPPTAASIRSWKPMSASAPPRASWRLPRPWLRWPRSGAGSPRRLRPPGSAPRRRSRRPKMKLPRARQLHAAEPGRPHRRATTGKRGARQVEWHRAWYGAPHLAHYGLSPATLAVEV